MALHKHVAPRVKEGHLFFKTRSRLQRITDSKHFSAWVEDLLPHQACFRLRGSISLIGIGDVMAVELAGRDNGAIFIGKVSRVNGKQVELGILRGITPIPKREHARVVFDGIAHVESEGTDFAARTVDLSEAGIGIRLPSHLEEGSELRFKLRYPDVDTPWQGKVLYCMEDGDSPGHYRAGVQIEGLDRLDFIRWKNLMNAVFGDSLYSGGV